MKYYTTKGDEGTTRLFNCPLGTRVSKKDGIFEVLGGVDELNCFVGWCRAVASRSDFCHTERATFLTTLSTLQEDLFIIQAELGGGAKRLSATKLQRLEKTIAYFSSQFPAITSFIVPGATELSALLDVSRTVARRVERLFVREKDLFGLTNTVLGAYLNRISSLLYVLARYANHANGEVETTPSY